MNETRRWPWLLALLLALVWYWHAHRPVTHPPGLLAADAPAQTDIVAPLPALH